MALREARKLDESSDQADMRVGLTGNLGKLTGYVRFWKQPPRWTRVCDPTEDVCRILISKETPEAG